MNTYMEGWLFLTLLLLELSIFAFVLWIARTPSTSVFQGPRLIYLMYHRFLLAIARLRLQKVKLTLLPLRLWVYTPLEYQVYPIGNPTTVAYYKISRKYWCLPMVTKQVVTSRKDWHGIWTALQSSTALKERM